MKIELASTAQSAEIASLIMEAMNYECCQNLAGPNHTLADFYRLMCALVARDDSQYSYRNTLVALSDNPWTSEHGEPMEGRGVLMGCCVSYDSALLHQLRQAFIDGAREEFGIDYTGMADETEPGELYIDSICVGSEFRHQGVATALLQATIEKACRLGIDKVALLVDKGNPQAEHLYNKVGFRYEKDTSWGGHAMKKLTLHPSRTPLGQSVV